MKRQWQVGECAMIGAICWLSIVRMKMGGFAIWQGRLEVAEVSPTKSEQLGDGQSKIALESRR